MRQIPYGEANFKKIRTNKGLYVDKTMYIEKLEQSFNREKAIYLRPRRFGKSLFTSMLTYYYSVDTQEEFEELFKGLYIYEYPTPPIRISAGHCVLTARRRISLFAASFIASLCPGILRTPFLP